MNSTFSSRVSRSWLQLFQFFKPVHLKKYLYITAKSYGRTLQALFKGGWFLFLAIFLWLIATPFLFFGIGMLFSKDILRESDVWANLFFNLDFLSGFLTFSILSTFIFFLGLSCLVSYWLFTFLVISSARSSSVKKDHHYFFDAVRRFFRYFVILVVVVSLTILIITALLNYFNAELLKKIYYVLFLVNDDSLGLVLNPMVIFGTLFLMDSGVQYKLKYVLTSANKNKIIWFAYPLIALIAIGFHQLYFCLEKYIFTSTLSWKMQVFVLFVILFFGIPLYITMLTNIYLQQMHEHYDWYHEKH